MSTILFISSSYTGHGHESILSAIKQQIEIADTPTRVDVVDGFSLGNRFLRALSRQYDPIAVNHPALWEFCYEAANVLTKPINAVVSKAIRKKLSECLWRVKPDLIVSIHPAFIGSVLNVLDEEGLDIPLVTVIADLDNVSALWADHRAASIICPTQEAKERMLELGVSENKLKVMGFPVRKEFCRQERCAPPEGRKIAEEGASILMINGSQGLKNVTETAKTLLDSQNCRLSIITGNNQALKKSLEEALLPVYGSRATVYGFIDNIADFMAKADILIIRASPNVMMEAVNLCKPMIIVGALSGQEKKNPEFAEKNSLGAYCKNIGQLPELMSRLLERDGAALEKYYNSQMAFRRLQAAEEIAEFVINESINYAPPDVPVEFYQTSFDHAH